MDTPVYNSHPLKYWHTPVYKVHPLKYGHIPVYKSTSWSSLWSMETYQYITAYLRWLPFEVWTHTGLCLILDMILEYLHLAVVKVHLWASECWIVTTKEMLKKEINSAEVPYQWHLWESPTPFVGISHTFTAYKLNTYWHISCLQNITLWVKWFN